MRSCSYRWKYLQWPTEEEFFHLRLFKKDENGNYPSFEDIDDIDEMLSDEDTYGLDYYFTTGDDFWFDDDEEPEEEDSTH